jgi:hypothetical protein
LRPVKIPCTNWVVAGHRPMAAPKVDGERAKDATLLQRLSYASGPLPIKVRAASARQATGVPPRAALPAGELIRSAVQAACTLSGLDAVLDGIGRTTHAGAGDGIARLSAAGKSELLQALARQLPFVPDHPDPYRSLARSALLAAQARLPEPCRGALGGLETGAMFEDAVQAVQCGVPVDVAVRTFGIADPAVEQRLNWDAEYAAKGHIYAGCPVGEAAALHGITEPQVLVALQPACTRTVAGAAVAAGAMTVDEAVRTFGITDPDEQAELAGYAEAEPTGFMQAILAGMPLDAACRTFPADEVIDRPHAEYLSVMSAHATRALRAGEDARALARRLGLVDPFARRLLERRAAGLGPALGRALKETPGRPKFP